MSNLVATRAFPEVINELFRPFDIKEPSDTQESGIYKELYVDAFDDLTGSGDSDLVRKYEVGGIAVELQRSEPYTDESASLGWGIDEGGVEVFNVGRSVAIKGLVAVTALRLEAEAFMAISIRDSFLEGSPMTKIRAEYGFQLPEEVSSALFGIPDKSFVESNLGEVAREQLFGFTIKALQSLEDYQLRQSGLML